MLKSLVGNSTFLTKEATLERANHPSAVNVCNCAKDKRNILYFSFFPVFVRSFKLSFFLSYLLLTASPAGETVRR